ncbi:tyrosine-type recombinase/integrase [Actinoplanes sp. NPDC051475]|uniref:tyrosine-type recombinase/integrase n=1 Tax=Actinoplanes sp. NPDC051475 TaxID=3157225 RepID=UPI003450FB57
MSPLAEARKGSRYVRVSLILTRHTALHAARRQPGRSDRHHGGELRFLDPRSARHPAAVPRQHRRKSTLAPIHPVRWVRRSELPPIRLHDLRHCAATYLKASCADLKDIQEALGHSSIAITGDTYISVIHELETERAKADAGRHRAPHDAPGRRKHAFSSSDTGGPHRSPVARSGRQSRVKRAWSQRYSLEIPVQGGPPGTRTPNLWIKSP